MKTVKRDCGHTDWADMLGAPCLECRMATVLVRGETLIRAAAAGVPLEALPPMPPRAGGER